MFQEMRERSSHMGKSHQIQTQFDLRIFAKFLVKFRIPLNWPEVIIFQPELIAERSSLQLGLSLGHIYRPLFHPSILTLCSLCIQPVPALPNALGLNVGPGNHWDRLIGKEKTTGLGHGKNIYKNQIVALPETPPIIKILSYQLKKIPK